jgi:hypothetical protein
MLQTVQVADRVVSRQRSIGDASSMDLEIWRSIGTTLDTAIELR